MKNIETLFESDNYDSKNITNKSSETIPQAALNKIETEGATLEFLNTLNVPVFKYKTQITIHGLFPALSYNYLGGYKNLFQNKNLSIGVKWQAVDFKKKDRIYRTVTQYLAGWHTLHNSTDYYVYKTSPLFEDKETYKKYLDAAKIEVEHIDKKLFFGNVGVYLSATPYGSYFLVTYINIGAILEANVIPVIENITKATMPEINAKFEADRIRREQEHAEYKARKEAELIERKAKQAPLMETARQQLIDAGYVLEEKTVIQDGKIYVKIETDTETGSFKFNAYKFSKEARQKKFRYVTSTSNDLNFEFSEYAYKSETRNNTYSGWVKPVAPIKPKKTDASIEPLEPVVLVQYSDRAIALFGSTKPIKDKINAIGGKFNANLTYNGEKKAGWILPATKREQAEQLINSL